ncbi:hypothetical protein RclHR1_12590008 [Rhizophagus clarus]|uniref:Reverse transcriptase domain-containing protein n=1 Tax=Rhizophagus clarus TaxID=94130 RepID=A0A2Z6Q7H1_9GLOM|nr:hypothetical protein RclHR1_12590008 [Rhizophagus clarus]
MMINNNLHILHVCETHETQAPHHESSKAHKSFTIQKITEVQHAHTDSNKQLHFHIINNPIDDGSRKARNAIIISDLFFKHIAKIHTIPGHYIYLNLNFKHKYQINIFGFYLPTNSTTNRQHIYESLTDVYKQHFNKKINTQTYNFVLGDFNDNDIIFDNHDTPIRQDGKSVIGYRKKFFELLKNQQYTDTLKVLQKLTTLSQKFNFNYIWPESLNYDNHAEIKIQFELLHKEIHKEYERHLNKHTLHNINKYIDRRQQDFSDNQTRMLNSILERKPQKITINRLLITSDDENPQLITNQEDIECITIDHCQKIASSNNPALFTSYENLTPFWQNIYKEKYKSPEQQSILTTPITLDELTTTIQSLPNNKAPGPTGITYEFWKHFLKPHYNKILTFFNNILNTGHIPSAWKEALLYPIPKPEFWNYQLDKTRPIILLETLRKIFVKIITNRLNKFLHFTNALQPNNQAGIAGSSTAEIILMIQTCIDIQITQNQKFYIMVQDLSKAYDRINLDLLILAMKRLNIPTIFQLTITNLFKGHKNSVIIGDHLTNSFDLKLFHQFYGSYTMTNSLKRSTKPLTAASI